MAKQKYCGYRSYRRYKKKGLCVRCGEKALRGQVLCASCKRKFARRKKAKKYVPARRTRIRQKICFQCMKPLDNDQWKVCNACHEKMIELSRKASEARKVKAMKGITHEITM